VRQAQVDPCLAPWRRRNLLLLPTSAPRCSYHHGPGPTSALEKKRCAREDPPCHRQRRRRLPEHAFPPGLLRQLTPFCACLTMRAGRAPMEGQDVLPGCCTAQMHRRLFPALPEVLLLRLRLFLRLRLRAARRSSWAVAVSSSLSRSLRSSSRRDTGRAGPLPVQARVRVRVLPDAVRPRSFDAGDHVPF
jgi:hypothetical protein